jgi:hypothetical protein
MRGPNEKPERLQTQLRFQVDRKKFKTREAADDAVKRARAHFMATGKSIAGVKIQGRWRNPDNRNPQHANWKTTDDPGQSLHGFWASLGKGRGALR